MLLQNVNTTVPQLYLSSVYTPTLQFSSLLFNLTLTSFTSRTEHALSGVRHRHNTVWQVLYLLGWHAGEPAYAQALLKHYTAQVAKNAPHPYLHDHYWNFFLFCAVAHGAASSTSFISTDRAAARAHAAPAASLIKALILTGHVLSALSRQLGSRRTSTSLHGAETRDL